MEENNIYNNAVDGYAVEEIFRESFQITGTPDEITIPYNDMVEYSKMLITTTMQSMGSKLYEMGLVTTLPSSENDSSDTNKKID